MAWWALLSIGERFPPMEQKGLPGTPRRSRACRRSRGENRSDHRERRLASLLDGRRGGRTLRKPGGKSTQWESQLVFAWPGAIGEHGARDLAGGDGSAESSLPARDSAGTLDCSGHPVRSHAPAPVRGHQSAARGSVKDCDVGTMSISHFEPMSPRVVHLIELTKVFSIPFADESGAHG